VKPRLVVLGGGGHAKVIFDILEDAGEYEIAGFVAPGGPHQAVLGHPWLGDDACLEAILRSGVGHGFVALGDNRRRWDSIGALRGLGFRLANAISPRAVVSRHAALGVGIAIMPGAVVNAGTQVGDGVIVNTNASVDHDCVLGPCAHVAPGCALAGCVCLGEGVFLGTGSSVIPRVAIGAWTVVGAGGVVVADLPEHVLALGIPAAVRSPRD
jgi:UDP-perosamine 4-acetyltransferase